MWNKEARFFGAMHSDLNFVAQRAGPEPPAQHGRARSHVIGVDSRAGVPPTFRTPRHANTIERSSIVFA